MTVIHIWYRKATKENNVFYLRVVSILYFFNLTKVGVMWQEKTLFVKMYKEAG